MFKLSEKTTLQKVGSEVGIIFINKYRASGNRFPPMFNGPLLIHLQYHRANETPTVFPWEENKSSVGPV